VKKLLFLLLLLLLLGFVELGLMSCFSDLYMPHRRRRRRRFFWSISS
jgi:hypothetical protein